MSILIRFAPDGMTADQYQAATDQIQEKVGWPPDGLQLHVCFGSDSDLRVSEIWESREQMEAFGEKLMPVLDESGIKFSGEPEVLSIHKLEQFQPVG